MIHKVPQGSFNSKIELAVANTSSHVTKHVKVEASNFPSWIKFESQKVMISEIQPGREGVAVFTFSVNQAVPVGTEVKLKFMIRSEHGEKWTKDIYIKIVKPSLLMRLANKLKVFAQQST